MNEGKEQKKRTTKRVKLETLTKTGLVVVAKAFFASCPVSLSHKSLYSKLIATLDRTTTNIDGTP